MRTLIVAMLVLLPTLAFDQTTTYRDGSGRLSGTSETQNGVTTYRDSRGRLSGTAETRSGVTTYRDGMGRLSGTTESSRR